MTRFFLRFAGAAVLVAATAAEARDGCGRGWFHNGVACAQEEGGYRPRYGYRDEYYGGPRYYRPVQPNFYGNTVRPVRGNNGAISCSNPRYTWQDGACRPYRGP